MPTGALQIAGIALLLILGLYFSQAPSKEEVMESSVIETAKPKKTDVPYVSIAKPSTKENVIEIAGTGSIVVRNSIDLQPQVSGRIVWVAKSFRRGGGFKSNQRLLQIDPKDFELALAQAQADRQSAESNYQLTKAQSEAAISNYAILNPGIEVPPVVAKRALLVHAYGQIDAGVARDGIAKLDLERTKFSLPFDGRVVDSQAEVGQLLNLGQKFGEAFDIKSIEALVPISPSDLANIQPAV